MQVKFNVKRKIVVNGRSYGSVAEMPEDLRHAYENALGASAGAGQPSIPAGAQTKIVFNGQEYRSVAEMPAETRAIYEMAMSAAAIPPAAGGTSRAVPAAVSGRPSPKQVYRRVWSFISAGIVLFVLIVILGTVLPANGELSARLPWALLGPLALFGCAACIVVRDWRCGNCGASLPTIFSRLNRRHCMRCGQPFDL